MADARLPRSVVDLGAGFWNLRGSFRLGGLIELGTQASLVRRQSGRFVLLDAIDLDDATRRWVDERTDGGEAIEAVLHLHPFHTLHVRALHARYPGAKLYGTVRHHERFPDLPWEAARTEDPALHTLFADDLDFSVPRGVELVPSNENLHFSSVLAFHRASKTLHVDDTLLYLRLPGPLRALKRDVLRFHPTLGRVLEPRAGAARDFRAWAEELVERARGVENLCAAHSAVLRGPEHPDPPLATRIAQALQKVEGTLRRHERAHG
jgi:hypothetical protein